MKATALPRTRRGQELPSVEAGGNGNGNGNGGNKNSIPGGKGKSYVLVKLERAEATLRVVGETGLIVHDWNEKAIQMMLDKQMGKASAGKTKKDPLADCIGSLYKMASGKGYGFPARGFKACFVKAANDVELMKTEMKRAIRVLGTGDEGMNVDGLVRIDSDPLPVGLYTDYDKEYEKQLAELHKYGISMRRDMVRLETGVADIRFRGHFPNWWAEIRIQFNQRVITHEQLMALVDAAGFGVGIGEWRPGSPKSESGQFGCFSVDSSKPINVKPLNK